MQISVLEVPRTPHTLFRHGIRRNEVNLESLWVYYFQGQDYIVMLVKVLNYNSKLSAQEISKYKREDSDFWVLVSEGAIGSNSVTVEINSYEDIDVDVEFYGYKEGSAKLWWFDGASFFYKTR